MPIKEPAPNGLRYPRVGGRGLCLRCGKSPKPRKSSKIAQTPTRRVHALLGNLAPTRTLIEKRQHHQHNKILTHNSIFDKSQKLNF